MRADFVALGVQLGWISADNKEDDVLADVMERLRDKAMGSCSSTMRLMPMSSGPVAARQHAGGM